MHRAAGAPAGGIGARPRHVLAQRQVAATGSEIEEFAPLRDRIALAGRTVTADAVHTQRDHARYLVERRQAAYLLVAKGNQPGVVAAISQVPEQAFPPPHRTVDRAHGRVEHRTVRAAPAPADLGFPYAKQVIIVQRHTTDLTGGHPRTEIAYAVTSLTDAQACPGCLARLLRGHWEIENRLHWVRDVVFGEDASRIRIAAGPRVMASLRNLAVSLLRLTGRTGIAAGLRCMGRDAARCLALLGPA